MQVALVSMPFNSVMAPSLQLGLLKAELTQHGFEARTFHLNLEFARRVGFREYEYLGNRTVPAVGEWLASHALFGDEQFSGYVPEQGFLDDYKEIIDELLAAMRWSRADLIRVRRETVPKFLDECLTNVDWARFDVVGFSSTFQQQIISLALARRIKAACPRIQIVFGGANNFEPMGREHLRAWEWIDHVCLGEADDAFPELIKRLEQGDLRGGVPGILSRVDGHVIDAGPAPMVTNMDTLPDPDYDEYFERRERHGYNYDELFPGTHTALPMETARGCWWGAKHHCTFCGLPALGMKFRSRSVGNVLAQLDRLSCRYNTWHFAPVDNIIDNRYIKELFGALAEGGYDYQIWYESKANLTPEQLRLMRNGGLEAIQPGIESLSSNILRIMNKGVTATVNVNTLKWARYLGLQVQWNIITGFPGETSDDYARILDAMKKIVHLQPPGFSGRIWLQRFSPYFEHPDRYPIVHLGPMRYYIYLYPAERVDILKVAYWFEYEMRDTVSDETTRPIRDFIGVWRKLWERPRRPQLFYMKAMGRLKVVDARDPDHPATFEISGDAMDILEFCQDKPHNLRAICQHLAGGRSSEAVPFRTVPHESVETRVQQALQILLARGVVLAEEGDYVTIALPMHQNLDTQPVWRARAAPGTGLLAT